jgi:hypothetical protein
LLSQSVAASAEKSATRQQLDTTLEAIGQAIAGEITTLFFSTVISDAVPRRFSLLQTDSIKMGLPGITIIISPTLSLEHRNIRTA